MRFFWLAVSIGFIAFAQQPPSPEQLFRDAVAAQQRGDDQTAIAKYQALLKLRPEVVEVRANLGSALSHAGRYDEAIAEYSAALTKSPDNKGLRLNLGLAYYKKADFAKASTEFETLRKADPNDIRTAILLAD